MRSLWTLRGTPNSAMHPKKPSPCSVRAVVLKMFLKVFGERTTFYNPGGVCVPMPPPREPGAPPLCCRPYAAGGPPSPIIWGGRLTGKVQGHIVPVRPRVLETLLRPTKSFWTLLSAFKFVFYASRGRDVTQSSQRLRQCHGRAKKFVVAIFMNGQ